MEFKVGDKVKLNKNIKTFCYSRAGVSYDEIGTITEVSNEILLVNFPSFGKYWRGLKKELILVSKQKHFKSLPNNYTGTIEVENGFIQEKGILDEAEKRYLKAVIRPFKNRVINIVKENCCDGNCYISISLNNAEEIFLPNFKKGTMYNGMEEDKRYTLKELELDV